MYNFNADGTGYQYVNPIEPDVEATTYNFSWSYDDESGKLTLSGEFNQVWSVSGYNNTYILLDEVTSEGENFRTILKRSLL